MEVGHIFIHWIFLFRVEPQKHYRNGTQRSRFLKKSCVPKGAISGKIVKKFRFCKFAKVSQNHEKKKK